MITALFLNLSKCATSGGEFSFLPVFLPVSTVAIVQSAVEKAEDITYPEIHALVKEAVTLAGGFEGLISDGDTVVLKPNLVTMADFTLPGWKGIPLDPEANGTTTDYRITRAVVELVREVNPNGKVYVMEGSSVPTEMAFLHHRYTHNDIPGVDEFIAIEKDSGGYKDTGSPGLVAVELPGALLPHTYYFNKKYYEADVLITLPCLKTHWHAIITGAIKNLSIGASPGNIYGNSQYSPGRNGMVNHESISLHYWLHDYYMARPADFVVMDGLQGIQNGPTPSLAISGTDDIKKDQMNMCLIIAGRDGVAVDTIESLLMGWDPRSVPYLTFLNKDGVGNLDTAYIDVVGKSVDSVRKEFNSNVVNKICKGRKIKDKEAPAVTIKAAELDNNTLRVSLEMNDNDLHFVKFNLGGIPLDGLIHSGYSHISIKVDDSFKQAGELTVEAYDMYLNVTRKTINLPFFSGDTCIAKKAASAPVIDGEAGDPCWENAVWFPIDELWLGEKPESDDFTGRFALSWSEKKLYILVHITDDILRDIHPDPLIDFYKDDCLEVFIDEDASGGEHTYNYNAFAYHVSLSYDIVDLHTDKKSRLLNDHMEVARVDKGTTSTWEIALTLYDDSFNPDRDNTPVALGEGKKIGFALAYCDNDTSDDRESFIGSLPIKGTDKNRGWIDADVFASLLLME